MKECCPNQGGLRRPGGFLLTERSLFLASFPAGARLLDICCGNGATVRRLEMMGFEAWGIDLCLSRGDLSPRILAADARRLCFDAEFFDGALMECCLSELEPPQAALREAFRVLRPGARLVISDLYARGTEASGVVRLDRRERIEANLAEAGFTVRIWEDHAAVLKQFVAQAIMDYGAGMVQYTGLDRLRLRAAHCGYYLMLAEKEAL